MRYATIRSETVWKAVGQRDFVKDFTTFSGVS